MYSAYRRLALGEVLPDFPDHLEHPCIECVVVDDLGDQADAFSLLRGNRLTGVQAGT